MKWIAYFFLALLACVFFLPHGESGIRNIPLLLSILACVAISILYHFLSLLFLAHRVKKHLKENDFQVKKTRLLIRKGYIIAENQAEVAQICLLLRRKKFCRHHFDNETHIELWKSTRLVTKRNMAGKIARGSVDTRRVGKISIRWSMLSTEKTIQRMIVMDQFPNSISDSARNEELSSGDCICASDIVLFDFDGFINSI